jgi:hypothetical protein
MGLRWDYESPIVERYDRMVAGLDFNAPSPAGANLRGAVLFAGQEGQPRGAFDKDLNNWQPRVGAAYRIGEKWVLRGGYGLYYLGQNERGAAQGFSRRTNAIVSTDGNLRPAVTLTNAFANQPGGQLLSAVGSSGGPGSFLGEGLTVNWRDRPLPYSHQFSFDIERELLGSLLAEIAYVGNITRKLPVGTPANFIPRDELGRRTPAGAIDAAYYTAQVPNPMAGLIPNNAGLNGATIPRQTLLQAFPHFAGLQVNNLPIGRQRYDGMQLKVSKRYSYGLTFLASYGIGKTLEQLSLLNPQDLDLTNLQNTPLEKRSATETDVPQKFVIAGVFELPFGKGKPWANALPGPLEFALGGWQFNWDITYQSGWAADYPNAAQVAPGSAKLDNPSLDQFFDTSLWINPSTGRLVPRQEAFTLRNFPTRFGDVRFPGYQNWDASVSKYFPIHEQIRAQFKFEMVNAFNHPWFPRLASGGNDVTSPNFGRLDVVQRNLPRFIKLALVMHW